MGAYNIFGEEAAGKLCHAGAVFRITRIFLCLGIKRNLQYRAVIEKA